MWIDSGDLPTVESRLKSAAGLPRFSETGQQSHRAPSQGKLALSGTRSRASQLSGVTLARLPKDDCAESLPPFDHPRRLGNPTPPPAGITDGIQAMPLSSPLSPLTIPLRRHPRLILALLTLITFLLLISLLAPDPTSPSFQWPGLLPSRYPPSSHPHNPILSQRLSTASDLLSQMCSSHGPLEPIYIDPGLTRAQERRYDHLRHTPIGNNNNANDPNHEKRILIVSTIRQIHNQLPDLLNTLVVLVTFLGGPRLAFSFLEGPSDDCTSEAFEAVVGPTLLSMGIPHHHLHLVTRENQIDFGKGNRMQILADLRNRALSPLWSDAIGEKHGGKDVEAVVMLNDVFLRARDILELLHQHSITAAGITTGWDWWQRRPGNYYDVWVGRTVSGQSAPADGIFPLDIMLQGLPVTESRWIMRSPTRLLPSCLGPPRTERMSRLKLESVQADHAPA